MKWWSLMAHRTCRPGGYTPRSASLWPHWSRGRWSSRARPWSEIIKLGWWHGGSPVQRVVQVGEQKKQPLGIETLKAVPNSIQNCKDQMNTKSTFYNSHCYFLHFEIYLSQILSAIKILLKQFLIDFLGYHLSSSYIQTFSEIWYRISFVAFNKPTLRGQECWQSFQQDQGLTPRSSGCWSPWRTEIWKVNALMSWSPFIATFSLFGTKQANQWEPSLCLCDLFDLYQTPAACQTMNGSWRKKRKMKTNIFCHFIWKR